MRNLIRQLEEQSRSGRGMNLNTEMNRLFDSFMDEVMRELASATGASVVSGPIPRSLFQVLRHPEWSVAVGLDTDRLPLMIEVSGDVPKFKAAARGDSLSVANRILKLMKKKGLSF